MDIPFLIVFLGVLIFSVILHEVAHGWVALTQGDSTAFDSGRLTLNPISHLDPLGSIIFPAICIFLNWPVFGWAKPVPVNPNNFVEPRSSMFKVSLAGPLTNFILATIAIGILSFLIHYTSFYQENPFTLKVLYQMVILNLVLGVFNMIPIPPLDGSKVLSSLLPESLAEHYEKLEPYGFFILMILMALGILGKFVYPLVITLQTALMHLAGIR